MMVIVHDLITTVSISVESCSYDKVVICSIMADIQLYMYSKHWIHPKVNSVKN